MKQLLIIALATFFCISCKKENAAPVINYAEVLKGTIWGGTYYDISNPALSRKYTIELIANDFRWRATSPATQILGTWSVSGNTVTFKFIGQND
jgi:hypothetical protein